MGRTVTFDIETLSADLLYTTPPEEFFRLGGYKWAGSSDVVITADLEEMREVIRSADTVVGHNIHSFDLPAIFGHKSDEPLQMAMDRKVYDTWTHAVLVHPAPYMYTNRFGVKAKGDSPEKMKAWFGLDEQAHQLGVKGKTHDLKELAYEFGDPSLPKKERIKDGFGKIPLDEPRYVEYLVGDVNASEVVGKALIRKGKLDSYAMREQEIEARKAVIQSNGFRVDRERAQARVDELAARREVILADLQERYGLPTDGVSPWKTDEGKIAILSALADQGITPKTVDWPKTPVWSKKAEKIEESKQKIKAAKEKIKGWKEEIATGDLPDRSQAARKRWIDAQLDVISSLTKNPLPPAFGLSMGGDALKAVTAGTAAEDLGNALAELMGQRSLAQLALDCTHADGFVHPQITMLQRSGRWSTTEPGLTVWTARGPGAIEKAYFLPDNDDEVILEIDYSNADARAVAAMSGDKKFAERFEPGADGHLMNAIAAWGESVVLASPESKAEYRQKAKAPGHGWGYRIGFKKLGDMLGDNDEGRKFKQNLDRTYRGVVSWQDRSSKEAARYGYVVNPWGRKMFVEKDREFTQGPALKGQSVTREIVCDALLAMPIKALRRVKAQIHDAMAFSVPKHAFERFRDGYIDLMEAELHPKGGQYIKFPVDAGPPGANWYEAGH